MNLLQQEANRHLKSYQKAQRAADAGEQLLISLGLGDIEQHATEMSSYHKTVYSYETKNYQPAPRLGVTIYILNENRSRVRDLLAAVLDVENVDTDRWQKEFYTQSVYNKGYGTELIEQWSIEFDGYSSETGAVFHSLTIRFTQEAVVGTVVNGCTIGLVQTAHPSTVARITEDVGLVCKVK